MTGLSHAARDWPAPNQITISESRQLRVIVSSTEMNMVSESSTGSAPSAKSRTRTPLGGKLAARGLAEQADEPRSDRDGEQRHEHRARETCKFPEQRPVEDHAILSPREI